MKTYTTEKKIELLEKLLGGKIHDVMEISESEDWDAHSGYIATHSVEVCYDSYSASSIGRKSCTIGQGLTFELALESALTCKMVDAPSWEALELKIAIVKGV